MKPVVNQTNIACKIVLSILLILAISGCSEENDQKSMENKPTLIMPSTESQRMTPNLQVLSGTLPLTEQDKDEVLAKANIYLESLKINDLASVYKMEFGSHDGSLSPLRFREIMPRGVLMSYSPKSVTFEDGEAIVEADVTVLLASMRTPYKTFRKLRWVRHNGQLYQKSKGPGGSFGSDLAEFTKPTNQLTK